MIPRPGTKTEKAVTFIRLHTSARTLQLAEHIGSSVPSVAALLDPYVKAGALLCCKVEIPGRPPQNEYRIGSGIPPKSAVPELKSKHTNKTPWRDKGSPHLPPPSTKTQDAPAAVPATQESPISRIELPSEISINEHGELRFTLDGKLQHLTPAQTRALGNFLFKTEGLWRPT